MRQRLSMATVCGMLGLFLVGAASGAEPADLVSGDAFVYVEAGPGVTQELLACIALPPVANLFMSGSVGTPFFFLERLLELPPGTVTDAARHLRKVALAGNAQGPVVIFAFDEPGRADALLAGGCGRGCHDRRQRARGRPRRDADRGHQALG